MRSVAPLIFSCVVTLAHPGSTTAQPPPPEVSELVPNLKDCGDAMRVWREGRSDPKNPNKKIGQPLAETQYTPSVVPVDGQPNRFKFTVVPKATVIYRFEWPNMSAADREAVVRHLPALRAHERRHWEIATEFVAKHPPVTIYPTDKFTIEDYLEQQSRALKKEQKGYDLLTLNGEAQSVLGPEWENLVFNCWPIHVLSQAYEIEVTVSSGLETSIESAKYAARDVEPFGPLFAGLPLTGERRTQPVIERTQIGSNGQVRHQEEVKGTPTAVGESFWPRHVVELPGAGSARAGIDIKFTSRQGEFIVDGIVGLSTDASAGGKASQRSSAKVSLTLAIGSPIAASATVLGCTLFDKDALAALGSDFVDREDTCTFRLNKMVGTDDFVAVFGVDRKAQSTYPPVPSTVLPKFTKAFEIRITEEQK